MFRFFKLFYVAAVVAAVLINSAAGQQAKPFGKKFPKLDNQATGKWWERADAKLKRERDQVVAFELYTHENKTLKMSAQLYRLLPDEPREVRLEFKDGDQWKEIAKATVNALGWIAHFRIADWDNTSNVS